MVLNFHKTLVKSQFFGHSLYSNCQNRWWSQLSVHTIHRRSTTGENQGLAHIVSNINGSYFTQQKLDPCNELWVPPFSGSHSPFPLFPSSLLLFLSCCSPDSMHMGLPPYGTCMPVSLPRVPFLDIHMANSYFLWSISLLKYHQN